MYFVKCNKVAFSKSSYSVSDYDEEKMVIKNVCVPSIWRNGEKMLKRSGGPNLGPAVK